MFLLYAKASHNWSARATNNWTLTQNGTDYQTPASGDTLDANGKTITLDENLTAAVLTSSVAAGNFTSAVDGLVVTAQIGAANNSHASVILTLTATLPKTQTVMGSSYGGTGSSIHGISLTGNGNFNITGNQIGGLTTGFGLSITGGGTVVVTGSQSSASTSSGAGISVATLPANLTVNGNQVGGAATGPGIVWTTVAGNLAITGNQTGGTASTAPGISVAGAPTVEITGDQTGGTLSVNYAVSITGAAAVTITGTSTASATGIAVNITNAGAVVRIKKVVGNGYGPGSAGISLVPSVNNASAAILQVEEMEYGPRGASPVHGPVRLVPLQTNSIKCLMDGGGTKTLLDSANDDSYPAVSDVRHGVAYGSSSTGTAYIPAASSVAAGVNVDDTIGVALCTAASIRAELAQDLAKIEAAEHILLADAYVPTDDPTLVIPAPAGSEDLTVVYGYTESITNVPRANIELTFRLVTTPAKSERILETAPKIALTDATGFVSITLQRGLPYRVKSLALGIDHEFTPTEATFNLLTLI